MTLPASVICPICHEPFRPRAANQTWCSPDCRARAVRAYQRDWARAQRSRKPPLPEIPCVVCEVPFTPDRRNAKVCRSPDCRARRKRAVANDLTRGVTHGGSADCECQVCGSPFRGHPNSVACSRPCRLARNNELARRRKGTRPPVCLVCGRELPYQGGTLFTCPGPCREIARKRRNRRTYEANPARRDRHIDARRRRKDEDPTYREQIARLDRDRRQRLNAAALAGEAVRIAAELSNRHGEESS